MAKKFKEYELLEDIIIPKGTIFSESNHTHYVDPIIADVGDGMKNATMCVIINDEVFKEKGYKFKEIK